MSVAHDVVPWLRLSGVDHALAGMEYGWHRTACGTFTPNGARVEEPKRKCRRCVARLAEPGTATSRKV